MFVLIDDNLAKERLITDRCPNSRSIHRQHTTNCGVAPISVSK